MTWSVGRFVTACLRKAASGPALPRRLDRLCTVGVLLSIGAYRLLLSRVSGRRCMFRDSCSAFARDVFKLEGWTAGRAAVVARIDNCNGRYVMHFDGHVCQMETTDGVIHEEHDVAPWLVTQYRRDHARLIEQLLKA